MFDYKSLPLKMVFGLVVLFWPFLVTSQVDKKPNGYVSDTSLKLVLDFDQPMQITDSRFLSVSIDTATWLGLKFWQSTEGGGEAKRLDLDNSRLNQLIKALGPMYLRVGGTDADKIKYQLTSESDSSSNSKNTLTAKDWDSLIQFVDRNQLNLFFTLSAGPLHRTGSSWLGAGEWSSSQFIELLDYHNSKYPHLNTITWEFGNELNAYWLIHGLNQQILTDQYASEYQDVRSILNEKRPGEQLAGPASAVWPVLGETIPGITEMIPDFLQWNFVHDQKVDILSWHYYPTQSQRCDVQSRAADFKNFADLQTYNEFRHWALKIKRLKDQYQPKSSIWLGETGSAQCGGEPGISDRYVSSLWWLDELGSAALFDTKLVIRQSLVGSDYALLNEKDYTPRPDYWASLFWKQIMGSRVLHTKLIEGKVSTSEKSEVIDRSNGDILESYLKDGPVRAYLHCTSPNSIHYKKGAVSLLLINLSPNQSFAIAVPRVNNVQVPTQKIKFWSLSARSFDDEMIMLNKKILKLSDGGEIPTLTPEIFKLDVLDTQFSIQLAPLNAQFLLFENANRPECID
jgi:heparanase 1